jgi:hypothetical protein
MWQVTDVVDVDNFKIASTSVQTYGSAGTIYKGKFYLLKESVDVKDVTGGNSITTSDHYNDTFILNNFDEVKLNFADGGGFGQRMGNSTNQVLSFSTDRESNDYLLVAAGLPTADGMSGSGTNQFGQDYYYQYLRDELCALSGGRWSNTGSAGVWFLYLGNDRTSSTRFVSGRSCLYV